MVELGLVQPLQHQAMLRLDRLLACQLIKVERVQLELDGIPDGAQAHGFAELAALHHGQVAAAHKALAIRQRESRGELMTLPAFPGVADLRAADLVLIQHAMTFGTRRRHYRLLMATGSAAVTPIYSSMPWAARRPAPMA